MPTPVDSTGLASQFDYGRVDLHHQVGARRNRDHAYVRAGLLPAGAMQVMTTFCFLVGVSSMTR
jgi:hypothetical protein